MAKISLIYDGLISLIEDQLTGYTRLANAYDIESNDILRVVKGYSVGFSSGSNTDRYICDEKLTTNREFIFTVTNLMTANEADATGRAVIEKSIIEDCYKVWKKLQSTYYLGIVQVASCKYLEDAGIEYTFGDNQKAISVISSLSIEYFE